MALDIADVTPTIRYHVELPRLPSKDKVQFDLICSLPHPVTGEYYQIIREVITGEYKLDGGNVFEQCYALAKGAHSDVVFIDS